MKKVYSNMFGVKDRETERDRKFYPRKNVLPLVSTTPRRKRVWFLCVFISVGWVGGFTACQPLLGYLM